MLTRRFWTKSEDRYFAANYHSKGARHCAEHLNRSIKSIYQHAKDRGISVDRVALTDDQVANGIRKYHPVGLSDAEIAETLLRETGIKTDRHRVGRIRNQLGLSITRFSAYQRQRVARKTREQLDKAGLSCMAQLRLEKWKQMAKKLGWPESLTIMAVLAMEQFYKHRMLTRVQLCELLNVKDTGRTAPCSNAPGGTVLAELQRAGLISRLKKAVPLPGKIKLHTDGPTRKTYKGRVQKTKHIDFYFINPGVEPSAERTA